MPENTYAPTPPFKYTVIPHVFSRLALTTLPYAVCTIRPEGSTDPDHALKAYADAAGIVRIQVRPSAESDELLKFVVDCEVEGQVTTYPLELRGGHEPIHDMPTPREDDVLQTVAGGSLRPALSDAQMLDMPDDALLEHGYPLRPNRSELPRAFQAWRQIVSRPMTVVKPHIVSRSGVQHGKGTGMQQAGASYANWSGFERLRSLKFVPSPTLGSGGVTFDEPYDWVHGRWHVPSASSSFNRKAYSSLWVGLDGDGTTDLVQAGTETDSITSGNSFIQATIMTCYAWTEFLPQQPTEQQVVNFPVSLGDDIMVEVWMGNAGSGPTLSGAFGVFLLMNLTAGVSTMIYTPVGTTRVGGSEAVWIMERPTINVPASGIFGPSTRLPDLANYGSAVMFDAYARKANSARHQGYVPYVGRNRQVTMTDLAGVNTLSTVTPIDSYTMRFDWKGFS